METTLSPLFISCFENTIGFEGGYYDNPRDRGGPTKFGIAYNFNKEWYHSVGITEPEMVKDLPLDLAMVRYHDEYWVRSKADQLGLFATKSLKSYFDMAIHGGITGTGKCLQKALNHPLVGTKDDLVVDGKVGTKTIQAFFSFLSKKYNPDDDVNDSNFCVILNAVRAEMYLSFYNDPENDSWYRNLRFLNSSLRRL